MSILKIGTITEKGWEEKNQIQEIVTGLNPDTCAEPSSQGLLSPGLGGLSSCCFQIENVWEGRRLLEGAESDAQADSQTGIRIFTLDLIMMTTV